MIRYQTKYRDTIHKCFAVWKNHRLSLTNYSYIQTHHKMGQHAGANARRAARQRPVATVRRTPPAPSSTTLPALSAISSSKQRNTCNAMKAKYSRSGQWHGWNLWRDMTCVKLEACFRQCVACISLAYGAVRRLQRHRTSRYSAPCLTCWRLETGL